MSTVSITCAQCNNKQELLQCSDCYTKICVSCHPIVEKKEIKTIWTPRTHQMCLECEKKLVCYGKGICRTCDVPYHWITENLAVGSCSTPYHLFDVVLNLNHPENGMRHSTAHTYQKGNTTVHAWGIRDTEIDTPLMEMPLQTVKAMMKEPTQQSKKVLIHCFAGFSRSVALAAAYLALEQDISVDDAVKQIQKVRKYIGPNPDFLRFFEGRREAISNEIQEWFSERKEQEQKEQKEQEEEQQEQSIPQ
jgi:hypothetical protein